MAKQSQLLVAALLAVVAPSLGAQGGVAVVGFETEGSVGLRRADYPALGMALSATLTAELASRRARVVALGPLAADRHGHVDMVIARRAAREAGASVVAVGQLLDQYGDIHLELRLVDATSGEPVGVIQGDEAHHTRDALALAIGALANALVHERGIGGTEGAPVAVPIEALLQFGRGLVLEAGGDRAGALSQYDRALELAPAFSAPAAARRRVGG